MWTPRQIGCFGTLALVTLAAQPAMSLAGGGRLWHDRNRAEADIESLRGDLRYAHGDWRLRVQYDIEIEDARRRDRFDLVLTVLERGRPLLDRRGRAVRFVVPLNRPTKIKRDEITFRRQMTIQLPDGSFDSPKRLRLVAKVVRADSAASWTGKVNRSSSAEGIAGHGSVAGLRRGRDGCGGDENRAQDQKGRVMPPGSPATFRFSHANSVGALNLSRQGGAPSPVKRTIIECRSPSMLSVRITLPVASPTLRAAPGRSHPEAVRFPRWRRASRRCQTVLRAKSIDRAECADRSG